MKVVLVQHKEAMEKEYRILLSNAEEDLPLVKVASPFVTTPSGAGFAMTPVGKRLVDRTNPKDVRGAFTALRKLHEKKFVHGDPR